MILKLTVENGQWKLGDKIITSTDVPLDAVVLATEKLYPNVVVELDYDLSPNPWFGKRLFSYCIDQLATEFKDVDLASLALEFANTEEKICTRCNGSAWYNADIKGWQCTDCEALYAGYFRPLNFITKRKIKNPRRFEKERKAEYFGKRTMKKP